MFIYEENGSTDTDDIKFVQIINGNKIKPSTNNGS